ncbi:MAG: hypothetical protein H7Y04_03115 [Verrucomicrobia bacterium]|nr:hypothetical protein [Cytophagales bacterium]
MNQPDFWEDPVKEILKPYLEVLISQLLLHETLQMQQLLTKLRYKHDNEYSDDISEEPEKIRQMTESEKVIKQIEAYMQRTEATFHLLTEKCCEELFFDALHWESYQILQTKHQQLLADNGFLRKQLENWVQVIEILQIPDYQLNKNILTI